MFTQIIELELIMAILIACGIVYTKKGKFTEAGQTCITDIVMDFVLPASILANFTEKMDMEVIKSFGATMIISVVFLILMTLAGKMLYGRRPSAEAAVFRYGLINSNALFIGLPVIQSLLGAEGALHQTMYMVFTRLYTWSYGLSLFTGQNASAKDTVKKLVTHPCMLATYFGVFMMLTGIQLPVFIVRSIGYFSSCLMALSMLLIGAILSHMDVSKVFRADIWIYTFLRLIAAPALMLGMLKLAGMPYIVTANAVLLAGMPCASLTAVFARRYDCDSELAGLIVALTTALSIVTIPIVHMVVKMTFQV